MLISYLIWNFVVGICMVPVFFIYVVNNEATIIIATILLFVLSLLLIVLSILYVVFISLHALNILVEKNM